MENDIEPPDYSADDEPEPAKSVGADQPCEKCWGSGWITSEIMCGDCAGTGIEIVF